MGLSGVQQQRLCFARTIAVRPEVVLMDEPCSALDPISTLAIEDLIHELKQEYTIVIVTHNMQQASRVSDRTGFFNIAGTGEPRSEEHTSELQSRGHLVCRLLLEKKKQINKERQPDQTSTP